MKKSQTITVICFSILLVLVPAYSTSMFELGLQELATGSGQIVQAKVTAIVPRWNKDSTLIHTYIRMNIVDDLLGDDEDNEIIIKTVGGRIGTLALDVEGTAAYEVGEDNILFLFQDPANRTVYQTMGMYQGKYSIFADPDNVERVSQDSTAAGVTLYKKSAGASVETGNNYTLEEFKSRILEYINNENK